MRTRVCKASRVKKSYVLPVYDIFVPRHDGKVHCTQGKFDCTHLCSDELLHEPLLRYLQADLQEHMVGVAAPPVEVLKVPSTQPGSQAVSLEDDDVHKLETRKKSHAQVPRAPLKTLTRGAVF